MIFQQQFLRIHVAFALEKRTFNTQGQINLTIFSCLIIFILLIITFAFGKNSHVLFALSYGRLLTRIFRISTIDRLSTPIEYFRLRSTSYSATNLVFVIFKTSLRK